MPDMREDEPAARTIGVKHCLGSMVELSELASIKTDGTPRRFLCAFFHFCAGIINLKTGGVIFISQVNSGNRKTHYRENLWLSLPVF
jgi:hypothetical protein